ncbi:MAG: ATP synthase F1 subunit delta [Flavobacteriales bacterium]|nr:ATP synthase F1 subunit delta [Flavobacteriales bacterium]
MHGSRAANRYAKSLYQLSIDQGVLEEVYADMRMIGQSLHDSKDLVSLLKSPIVKTDRKWKVLETIYNGKVNKVTLAFIRLMTQNKREALLEMIGEHFVFLYKQYKGIITAEVTAAVSLDEDMKKKILSIIGKTAGSNIEIVEKTDPSLIGGFIIKFGDKQYDASVAHRLKELKKAFSENPYLPEF